MKIDTTRPYGTGSVRRSGAKTGSGSKPRFSIDTAEDAPSTAAATDTVSTAAMSSLGALLAVQEVGDALSGPRKGLSRGGRLLDRLDEVRHGLLAGGIPRPVLEKLRRELAEERARNLDPGLGSVLDEIDLRARVELAKYAEDDLSGLR